MIISFPNHIFSRLQPLDRSVYGPFKDFVNSASDAWIKGNPRKTITIYDIPFIVCQSVPNSLTKKQKSTILEVSVSDSEVSSHSSTSILVADSSTSNTNGHQLNPVDIRLSQIGPIRVNPE